MSEDDDYAENFIRRPMMPPMSASFYETCEESLFRAIVTSNMEVLVSPSAAEAIEKRCAALGIK